jgi:protein YIPF5/7
MQETSITLYNVMSFLGYSLLPMLILAAFGIVISLKGSFGVFASLFLAAWSSYTAGNIVSLVLNRAEGKILLVYPLFLFYLSFALIIIF